MNGYLGNVLRVNLSTGKVSTQPLDLAFARKYIGGRGFNSRILYDELKPGIDPLGPENKIVISCGPSGGTEIPGSQRFTVSAKSPLSGFLGDSNSGGSLGVALKYAGFDALIIEGQSPKPVYLWIHDGEVELKPAGHIWGKTTNQAHRQIVSELANPDISVMAIGIGGENLVRFASIIVDMGRGLGRTGMGAVMGAKKLKAIAAWGSHDITVADPKMLHEEAKAHRQAWLGNQAALAHRVKYGAYAGWVRYRDFGMAPTNNFQYGTCPDWQRMQDDWERYFFKQRACFSCPAGCDHMWVLSDGPFSGTYGHSPNLTVPGDFGPRIGNCDLALALKAATLCDEYGLDYLDMGGAIGFAMECYERGILTEKDTGGLALKWGDKDAIIGLIEMIAHRQGLGDVLAQGLKPAAQIIGQGAEKYAMHVKGVAFVMRNVRASKAWGLGYAVSSRGACHVRSHAPETYAPENWDPAIQGILRRYHDPTNPLTEEGKAAIVKWHEDLHAFMNSMETCLFTVYSWMFSIPDKLARYVNAVTGSDLDAEEVMQIGERIVNLEKAFNLREGLTRQDDSLPERMLKEPLPDGVAKGQTINLEPMITEYYELRGWDGQTGLPTAEKLKELSLPEVADDLAARGLLADTNLLSSYN